MANVGLLDAHRVPAPCSPWPPEGCAKCSLKRNKMRSPHPGANLGGTGLASRTSGHSVGAPGRHPQGRVSSA